MTRDQIERIRDGWAATGWLSTDDANALFDHALSEQSRIDAAVAKERERCEQETRRYAGFYLPHSDGRNTFVMLADFIAAGRTPTPTTEEGA